MPPLVPITVEQITAWGPCASFPGGPYSPEGMRKLFGKREELNFEDVLSLPIIAEDRLWVLLRSELYPEHLRFRIAAGIARVAADRYARIFPPTNAVHDCAEALSLLARGCFTKDICYQLGVRAQRAVNVHLQEIYRGAKRDNEAECVNLCYWAQSGYIIAALARTLRFDPTAILVALSTRRLLNVVRGVLL